MFNLFKKKISTQDALLISIKSALFCYIEEKVSNGLPSTPSRIEQEVKSTSTIILSQSDTDLITFWASRFLYEKTFIEKLALRALKGPLEMFSREDELIIEKIIPEAYK